MRHNLNRRRFLQALGLTGLAAGYAGLGPLRRLVRAAEGDAPKRLLVLSHCHGWAYDGWKMRPGGAPDDAAWAHSLTGLAENEFSAALAPLYQHRARMLPIDGVSLGTAELDVDGNRHDTGWVHAWTGNAADFSSTDTRSTSASIDQLVASAIARPDQLPSLELGLDAGLEVGRPISYAQTGIRLPVAKTASEAWQRLFGLAGSGSSLVARQRHVIEFAYDEYQALKPSLGAAQKERLGAHFDLLQGLRQRIEGLAGLSCPSMPEQQETPASYDERFDLFTDLIAAGFACDVTRVATLSLGEMPTPLFGADDISDDVHKGIAHGVYEDPDKHQAMVDYLVKHAEQVARLVSRLESIPDPDGGSVMDNTLIVWGSELADGWHGYRHYCPVLIGGSWHFQTGRYVHRPHQTPIQHLSPMEIEPGGYTSTSGLPHQKLLVSVAQAMALEVDRVGIDAVQGQSGARVECTGPLPDLT